MQLAALVLGVVFLLVGVLGFIPGVTTRFSSIEFASHESQAELLGLFQVSVLHNLVHLVFGVVGVLASRARRTSRGFLIIGGVVYLALFVYGLLVPMDSAANFVPMNTADDILHIVLAVAMLGLGLALGRPVGGPALTRPADR